MIIRVTSLVLTSSHNVHRYNVPLFRGFIVGRVIEISTILKFCYTCQHMQEILNQVGNSAKCPIALIISGDKILLGHRHYTPDIWKTISVWTCPGGRCDEGEAIETALRREVTEEIGIENLEVVEYLGEFPGAREPDRVPVFLCHINEEPRNIEPHKFSEWKWFSKEYFPDTFINKEVEKLIKTVL